MCWIEKTHIVSHQTFGLMIKNTMDDNSAHIKEKLSQTHAQLDIPIPRKINHRFRDSILVRLVIGC